MTDNKSDDNALFPLHVFNFQIDFIEDSLGNTSGKSDVTLCSGAFSECTGLEATMEPKVIKEGGRNYGPAQRAGQVSFATVILKRGMTTTRSLWRWFELVTNSSKYAYRLSAFISVYDHQGKEGKDRKERKPVLKWKLEKAIPIKFKSADLNAKGTEVGIEELHLAHEGLTLEPRG